MSDDPSPQLPPSSPADNVLTRNERKWAMLAHLSGPVTGFVLGYLNLYFLAFLAPLMIYLIKKEESVFIADQAREALNFMIILGSFLLVLAGISLIIVMLWMPGIFILLSYIMWGVLIVALIFTAIAATAANDGKWYRYPFTLQPIK